MNDVAISPPSVARLRQLLFASDSESTYAILDGASVPGLPAKLRAAKEEWACLYRGELEPDLAEVAPYLIKLRRQSPLTDWILGEGWGRHWGIFAITQAGLEALRRHLRGFLRVKDSTGKILYFRYYDPRVLRVYLPTCKGAELKTLFGPVSRYAAEGDRSAQALVFQPNGTRLATRAEDLEGEANRSSEPATMRNTAS
jgi:hypothetical protein